MRNPRLLLLGLPALLALAVQVRQSPPAPPTAPQPARAAQPERVPVPGAVLAAGSVPLRSAEDPGYALDESGIYLRDQVMIAPRPGADLAAIAADVGAEILSEPGVSGYAVLRLRGDAAESLAALQGDARVQSASRDAILYGSGVVGGICENANSAAARANRHQWHLADMNVPPSAGKDFSEWTVAVLDSGVAYTAAAGHVQAPSLAPVSFVAPLDLVDGDELPLDEHWHGTHIASIIASRGSVEGVAPGVTLMPVRVLDEHNSGVESDLIEGIYHAIANGADVINLSLSFPLGYAPSPALRDALQAASDAGIVLVAAAGNSTARHASWPAASPLVIAVGASKLTGTCNKSAASYANTSSELDLMASGGQMGADLNVDGYDDGILAETIVPGDPSRTGEFFAVGSSQAAAVVSGAVVQLLEAGASPDRIPSILQASTTNWGGYNGYNQGYGAGGLDVHAAISKAKLAASPEYHVSLTPYLLRDTSTGNVRPKARVRAVDGTGKIAPRNLRILGTLWSESGPQTIDCNLGPDGMCDLFPSWWSDAGPHAWMFVVEAVVTTTTNVATRPSPLLHATDAFEILNRALERDTRTAGGLLGFTWTQGTDSVLGNVAAGFSTVNLESGLDSNPQALILTQALFDLLPREAIDVSLDGTGLSSSPLGVMKVTTISLGSGLSSSPLGVKKVSLVAVSGTGLSSSTLGFKALTLTAPTLAGSSYNSPSLSLTGQPVFQATSSSTASLAGTTTRARLDAGGWVAGGYDAATLGAADETIGLPFFDSEAIQGSGAEAEPVLRAR